MKFDQNALIALLAGAGVISGGAGSGIAYTQESEISSQKKDIERLESALKEHADEMEDVKNEQHSRQLDYVRETERTNATLDRISTQLGVLAEKIDQ